MKKSKVQKLQKNMIRKTDLCQRLHQKLWRICRAPDMITLM